MGLSPAVNNRGLERVSATVPVSLLLDGGDSDIEHYAYTVDICKKGARVRSVIGLLPGEMVGIAFEGDSGEAIPSRVVWVERLGIGSIAGLEFLEAGHAYAALSPIRILRTHAIRYSG